MNINVKVEQNVDLSEYTTYQTGGKARYFARANNWQSMLGLREFAKNAKIPYLILGGGSNILFSDDGFKGLVILNQMDKIQFHGETVTAESATSLSKLILIAAQNNLGGISGLSNVPGSIGGAICGNAGVPDMTIADVFMNAVIIPEKGINPIVVGRDYCQFGYRTSSFKSSKDIIISVTLKLKRMPSGLIRSEINKYTRIRTIKQPAGRSCGSFFRNPGEFPSAGWLIEQSGCKGMKMGGAIVSDKHANFIINTGKATSSDIVKLALKVHKKVKDKYDVDLKPEVQIFPDNPFNQ